MLNGILLYYWALHTVCFDDAFFDASYGGPMAFFLHDRARDFRWKQSCSLRNVPVQQEPGDHHLSCRENVIFHPHGE